MPYTTEREARLHYLTGLLRCCGTAEGSEMHKTIVDLYNRIDPLPRGYRAVLSDDWCAIFLCGIAHSLGYRGWPFECSCSMLIGLAEAQGRWHRPGTYLPQPGDWVIYDWGPNGRVDHIGAVAWIEEGSLWIVEGNNGDSVRLRSIASDDERIYGCVELDFAELVEPSGASVEALRPGDTGGRVRFLQSVLYGYGYYSGALDGTYGPGTTAAVTAFQQANGLEPDGRAGPRTLAKLNSGAVVTIAHPEPIIEKEAEAPMNIYNTIGEVPAHARAAVEKLVALGVLKGTGTGLGLTDDKIFALVILDRLGLIPA